MAQEAGADRIVFRPPYLDVDRYPLSEQDRNNMAVWKPTSDLYQIESVSSEKHYSRCGWHYTSAAINWDGSVAPCCTVFETRDDFGTLSKMGEQSYMSIVNNGAFRRVRDRFAGRLKDPVPHVCEHCPTPGIMDYHRFLNRRILLFTLTGILAWLGRLWKRPKARGLQSAVGPLVVE